MLARKNDLAVGRREASAALTFMIDRRAGSEIASSVRRPLPAFTWPTRSGGEGRDSVAARILALRGVTYVPYYGQYPRRQWYSVSGKLPVDVSGYDWAVPVAIGDTAARVAGGTRVGVIPATGNGLAIVVVGRDTLEFDLRPFLDRYAAGVPSGTVQEPLRFESRGRAGHGVLALEQLTAHQEDDSVTVDHWHGWLLLKR